MTLEWKHNGLRHFLDIGGWHAMVSEFSDTEFAAAVTDPLLATTRPTLDEAKRWAVEQIRQRAAAKIDSLQLLEKELWDEVKL